MHSGSPEVISAGRDDGGIHRSSSFLYIVCSLIYVPIAALAPGVASVIMMTAMLWAPADHIGNNVARIIVKAVILIIAIMIEFCIVINATLPWLERKTATPPRVRKIED